MRSLATLQLVLIVQVSALVVTPACIQSPVTAPRSLVIAMAKNKGGWTFDTSSRKEKSKAPNAKKADDKSWGLGELFSGWGEAGTEPDSGPKLGGGRGRAAPKPAAKSRSTSRSRPKSNDPFDPARNDRRLPTDTGASTFKWPWDK